MKVQRLLWCLFFSLTADMMYAGNPSFLRDKTNTGFSKITTINTLDTVVFDLAQSDTSLNQVEFPVYILSDDTVNALDFSFKYNELDFSFDSIIDLTTYMQTFSYYNPFDSTLRFTSNSFQGYEKDSALLTIRFTILSGQFCDTDLRSVKVYLNGEVCSVKIVDCLHVNVAELNTKAATFTLYPNPVIDAFTIEASQDANIELFQMDGRIVLQLSVKAFEKLVIDTKNMDAGLYLLRTFNAQFNQTEKIIIQPQN